MTTDRADNSATSSAFNAQWDDTAPVLTMTLAAGSDPLNLYADGESRTLYYSQNVVNGTLEV